MYPALHDWTSKHVCIFENLQVERSYVGDLLYQFDKCYCPLFLIDAHIFKKGILYNIHGLPDTSNRIRMVQKKKKLFREAPVDQ